MDTVVVYSPYASRRLTYVLDWLLRERLQLSYRITHIEQEAMDALYSIVYGKPLAGKISIPDKGLMKAAAGKLSECHPDEGTWGGLPVLFPDEQNNCTLPFDLFSAVFYLISRYEEYMPFTPDRHGRFPSKESILYKLGWLERPVVDEWVHAFRLLMQDTWHIEIRGASFSFQPSYDIDMAYSHAYKGIKRIVGAYIRALLKGDVQQISERTQVLKKKATDPYDSFAWLRRQHEAHGYKPLYFILSTLRTTAFDKNIHPKHPAMVRVIKQLAKEGGIGIHPSYYATVHDVLAKEKNTLEDIIAQPITLSRQHYIRLIVPGTYQLLADNEVAEDYSMGYGSHIGFRAGTGSSFMWYDLQQEAQSAIRTHPFCFMDTTAHYDMHMEVGEAFARLDKMAATLRHCGSTLVTVFHNFSLGTDQRWEGWSTAYEQFMKEIRNK